LLGSCGPAPTRRGPSAPCGASEEIRNVDGEEFKREQPFSLPHPSAGSLSMSRSSSVRCSPNERSVLERHIVGERMMLLTIAVRLVGGRMRLVLFATFCSAEKRHLFRDHLHHVMLGSGSILVLAALNASLNRDQSAAVDVVRTGFRQPVEGDYRKPRDLFAP